MLRTYKFLVVAGFALLTVACNPKHQNGQQQSAKTNAGTTEQAAPENGPGLRVACADEIQKYCASDPRKRRCLRENMDKLGDTCKTAVNAPRTGGNGRGGGGGVARVCADDLQKFCANDQKRMRCLKTNLAQLSDACKTAVTAREQQHDKQPANDNP
jgi:hypothetical protein